MGRHERTDAAEHCYHMLNRENLRSTIFEKEAGNNYDFAGRLESLQHDSTSGAKLASYGFDYDTRGRLTQFDSFHDGAVTLYDWDHRNRLVGITDKTGVDGSVTSATQYTYDPLNRRIKKAIDRDGDGSVDDTVFVVNNDQRAARDDAGDHPILLLDDLGDVTKRYVYGAHVDQILADEQIDDVTGASNVLWPLSDHQGSIRDVADYDSGSTTVVNHIKYDAFGNVVSQSNAAVDHIFGFTGRERDEESDLQYNRARYHDSSMGKWISQDPIGFAAGDANLYRYVGNGPTTKTDPSGLDELDDIAGQGIGGPMSTPHGHMSRRDLLGLPRVRRLPAQPTRPPFSARIGGASGYPNEIAVQTWYRSFDRRGVTNMEQVKGIGCIGVAMAYIGKWEHQIFDLNKSSIFAFRDFSTDDTAEMERLVQQELANFNDPMVFVIASSDFHDEYIKYDGRRITELRHEGKGRTWKPLGGDTEPIDSAGYNWADQFWYGANNGEFARSGHTMKVHQYECLDAFLNKNLSNDDVWVGITERGPGLTNAGVREWARKIPKVKNPTPWEAFWDSFGN